MAIEMDKNFDHVKAEKGREEFWIDHGYFKAGKDSKALAKKPFSLIVPPPNVTGKLHIGHAKDNTEQDIIARYRRLLGYDVLYLPGMDHAGIATQAKVEAKLRAEGKDKYKLGREGFLKAALDWKDEYSKRIYSQWLALGLSLDYSKLRFTLDPGMQKAVAHVFKTLYDQGLIYQGERIINWDPVLKTALSNIEVIHKDIPGKFYYFKYVSKDDPTFFLTVATTRPETMFGDTALVVNPKDGRYAKYVGREFVNPANGQLLTLIADRYVTTDFGTGVMKCTPAHDPNDFNIGLRHHLKMPIIMNEDGTMNKLCGEYVGLDRFDCRDKLVAKIKSDGNLIKIDDIVHNVGHSERSGAIVEPYLCKQWFVKMKPLAQAVDKIQHSPKRTRFFPARFAKTFQRWLDTTEDWCISRQLWWGHRIPVYTNRETKQVVCSETPLDPAKWDQDPDVLDTWFSSGLAPFAFLGWPDKTDLLKRYYPLDVLDTGYDIIFFWVARMAFDGVHFTGKMPFKAVVLHGLLRDSQGRKMSKSLGNGIDPFDIIDKYGCDALRWALSSSGAPGLDLPVGDKNWENAKEFINKVWNASRFVLASLPEGFAFRKPKPADLSFIDVWLYSRLDKALKGYRRNMDKYEHGQAAKYLYDFIYDDFCGNYLEWSKVDIQGGDKKRQGVVRNVLVDVLISILMLLFPFCPFVTEQIYSFVPGHKDSLFDLPFPKPFPKVSKTYAALGNHLDGMIKYVRNLKADNGMAPNAQVDLVLKAKALTATRLKPYLIRFSFAKDFTIVSEDREGMRYFGGIGLLLKASDQKALEEKIAQRIAFLNGEIARGERLLSNQNFVAKANPKVVDNERRKLAANKEELAKYSK